MKLAGIRRRALVFVLVFVVGAVPAAIRGASLPGRIAISVDVVSEGGLVSDVAGDEGQNEYSAEEGSEIVELASWGTMTSIFDGLDPGHTAIPATVLGDGDDDDDDDDSVCDLLENPTIRAKLSSGLETALVLLCSPQGAFEAPTANRPCSSTEPGGPIFSDNALVNDPTVDDGFYFTESETTLAINHDTGTICVGYNDYGTYTSVPRNCDPTCQGFSRGTAGESYLFEDRGQLPTVTTIDGAQTVTWEAWADPSIVWSKRDSRFYYSALVLEDTGYTANAVALWQSTDDCITFEPVEFGGTAVLVDDSVGDDKPFMAIDNNPSSPYYGRIYVMWADFSASSSCSQCIHSAYSDDSGRNWSTPVPLTSVGEHVQGVWPVVAPNGHVFAAWVHADPWFDTTASISIEIARSTNGGGSFTQVTNPMSDEPICSSPLGHCGGKPCLLGDIKVLPFPQLAVGPSCTPECELHAVYMYDPDGLGEGDVADVFYRRSTDGGGTWRHEVKLNDNEDPPGISTDQWFPTIGVGPNGRVVTSWYDRRRDSDDGTGGEDDNCWFDRFAATSYNGGKNWNGYWPNSRLSDRPSQVYREMEPYYQGDYDQIIVDPFVDPADGTGYAYHSWGATLDDGLAGFDQDPWFTTVSIPKPSELFWDGFESSDTLVWDSSIVGQ